MLCWCCVFKCVHFKVPTKLTHVDFFFIWESVALHWNHALKFTMGENQLCSFNTYSSDICSEEARVIQFCPTAMKAPLVPPSLWLFSLVCLCCCLKHGAQLVLFFLQTWVLTCQKQGSAAVCCKSCWCFNHHLMLFQAWTGQSLVRMNWRKAQWMERQRRKEVNYTLDYSPS